MSNKFVSKENIATFSLVSLFFLISLCSIWHHAIWYDEAQAWVIARESVSIKSLLWNIKSEGHPAVWYLLLMPLTRFFASPFAMQLLHIIIATLNCFIILKYAPFTRWQKLFLAFGYFNFFEYNIISRNYALISLFLMLLGISYRKLFLEHETDHKIRQRHYYSIGLWGLLLCHTHAMAMIIIINFLVYFIWQHNRDSFISRQERTSYFWCVTIMFLGIVTAILQLIPPTTIHHYAQFTDWFHNKSFFYLVLFGLAAVWIPINHSGLHYWGNYIWYPDHIQLGLLFATAFYLYVLTLLSSSWKLLLMAIGILVAQLLFINYFLHPSIRHFGIIYLGFIFSLWLLKSSHKSSYPILTLLFAIQCIAGIGTMITHSQYPFSASNRLKQFLIENNLTSLPIVTANAIITVPTEALFPPNTLKLYFAEEERFGAYMIGGNRKFTKPSNRLLTEDVEHLSKLLHSDILLANFRHLEQSSLKSKKYTLVFSSTDDVTMQYNLLLYRYHYVPES